jgi:RNA polymerase sigma factor (sigma-70 family)
MPSSAHVSNSTSRGPSNFALTRWSIVLAAGRSDSTHARESLEELCQTYWPPLYAFVRRQGHSPHDAQDLTQEFFARLLEKNYLGAVDRTKGRFRSFLLASLKHFLANEWDKAGAQKRGGHQVLIPIDARSAETRAGLEPAEKITADKIFERRWALTLLDLVLARLRAEYVRDEKTNLFEHLKSTLTGERRSLPYADIGARLAMTEGAVKVAVHRLRQRYREILREEIAHTVSGPEQIEEEIRALFAALEA